MKDLPTAYRLWTSQLASLYPEDEAKSILKILIESRSGKSFAQVWSGIFSVDVDALQVDIDRLLTAEPIQYVLGEAWFGDLLFKVDKRVLIPRPETAEMVELALQNFKPKRILDACTGSGCIPILAKFLQPESSVCAFDVEVSILDLARENAQLNDVEVDFFLCDMLKDSLPEGPFDLIFSNPPYIHPDEAGEMRSNVLEFEPHLALFTPIDESPTIFYDILLSQANKMLSDDGQLWMEINPNYSDRLMNETKKFDLKAELILDQFGKSRFLKVLKG